MGPRLASPALDPQARAVLDALAGPPIRDVELARAAAEHHRPFIATIAPDQLRRSPIDDAPVEMCVLAVRSAEPRATVVYFHGGGWTVGSPELLEGSCALFARAAGVQVVTVRYRLAPEHPFPAAYDDCLAAARHVVRSAREPVALLGESAGGNLVAAVAAQLRDDGADVRAQILFNPAMDPTMASASYQTLADGFGLTRDDMRWFWRNYLGDAALTDPRVAPAQAPAIGLPATYVLTSAYDPLHDEGVDYVEHLLAGGVHVEHDDCLDLAHDVFWSTGAVDRSREAVLRAAAWLKGQL